MVKSKKIRISKIAIFFYLLSIIYLTFKTSVCEFIIGRGSKIYLIFHSSGSFLFPIFLVFFIVFWILKKIKVSKAFISFFFLFSFLSVLSFVINDYKYSLTVFFLGFITLGRHLFYPLFFSSFKYEKEDVKKIIDFLLFFVITLSFMGIIEYFFLKIFHYKIPFLFTSSDFAKKSYFSNIPRISALFEHSNRFANIELFGFNLLISFFFIVEEKKYFFSLIPVLAVIFFTYSREAFVGIILTGIVILLFNRSKKILLFLSTSILLFLVLDPEPIINKILDFFSRFEKGFMGSGFYFRAHAFFSSLKVLGDHIFLGVGPGRFGSPVTKFFPSVVEKKYSLFIGPFRSLHTMDMFFPVLWSELGILGFLLFLIFYIYVLFLSFNNYKYFLKKDRFISAINLAIFLEIINILFIGFVSFSVNTVILSLLIFGATGIILRFSYDERKRFENESFNDRPCT